MSQDRVEIADDGVGCDAEWGNGLTGLRRRVEDAGGTFTVTVDEGTTVLVSMTGEGERTDDPGTYRR